MRNFKKDTKDKIYSKHTKKCKNKYYKLLITRLTSTVDLYKVLKITL